MIKLTKIKDIVINPTLEIFTSSKPKQYIPPKEDILILELMSQLNENNTNRVEEIVWNWEYAALIVETRKNNYLFDIIKHTLSCLPSNFGLYIVGSAFNQEWLQEQAINHTINQQKTQIMSLDKITHFGIKGYNELMLSPKFWQLIKSQGTEKVLIFQPDGFPIRNGIEPFLNYDYIGAPWRNMPYKYQIERIPKINQVVGNGGLSLRSVSKMIQALDEFPARDWLLCNYPEDVYYASVFPAMGFNIADPKTAMEFSHETVYDKLNSFGSHCGWRYNPEIGRFIVNQFKSRLKLEIK